MPKLGLLLYLPRTSSTVIGRIMMTMDPEKFVWIPGTHPIGTISHALDFFAVNLGLCLEGETNAALMAAGATYAERVGAIVDDAASQGRSVVMQYACRPDFWYLPERHPKEREIRAAGGIWPPNKVTALEELPAAFELDLYRLERRDLVAQFLSHRAKTKEINHCWFHPSEAGQAGFAAEFAVWQKYRNLTRHIPATFHEDFVANPDAELRKICTAFGMKFDPNWRDNFSASNLRWSGGDPRARFSDHFAVRTDPYNLEDFPVEIKDEVLAQGVTQNADGSFNFPPSA